MKHIIYRLIRKNSHGSYDHSRRVEVSKLKDRYTVHLIIDNKELEYFHTTNLDTLWGKIGEFTLKQEGDIMKPRYQLVCIGLLNEMNNNILCKMI